MNLVTYQLQLNELMSSVCILMISYLGNICIHGIKLRMLYMSMLFKSNAACASLQLLASLAGY